MLEIEKALTKKRQSEGSKNGRDTQLGPSSDDSESNFKAKSTNIVAKKVGVSTRTFERGKKILEKASEDDKQKLREGKTSISKVYQDIVRTGNLQPQGATDIPVLEEAPPRDLQNKVELLSLLEKMLKQELFCPSCGNSMFECSKCHKTLKALLKSKNSQKNSLTEG